MTTRHPRAALLLAAATAAVALKASHWRLNTGHHIELKPQPRRSCPDCRGTGGWWVDRADPEMEACSCWSDRRELRVRLLPVPAWPDGPPF
ncbi:hypothetical protein AB0948_29435 [Streptomyces koyangensis]|uniref:hypothetical protein n=1 Tax=Streptomyces koyangensis TaxID=188770 RepID=UPI003452F04A